jgi:ABC-type glycerol-3-phosphate transport system substrate-binding protein
MGVQKTSRRDFLKAAAGTVGAGALAATGLQTATKPAAAATAATAVRAGGIEPTGTMWGLNYLPHVQAYHRMADLFKKKYGSTITVQPQPYGYTSLIAAIAAGTQPDVVCQNGQLMAALILQGALTRIDQSVYKYNNTLPWQTYYVGDAVVPFSLGADLNNLQIYGVPVETDGGLGDVLNIPVDAVKKLGLEKQYPPTNGQFYFNSYDDLFALAKKLQTYDASGKVKRWGLCGEGWDLPTIGGIMYTLGTPVFDQAAEKFNFNTPAGIRAMQLHVEIPVRMGIEKEWNDGSAVIDEALNGNAAITMANGTPEIFGKQYGYDYAACSMPKIDGKIPQSFGEGQGWGIVGPVKVQHPNLQLAYLRMMDERDGQYAYDLTYGGVAVVAWKDILLHDTSRFHPPSKLPEWLIGALENAHYIGRAGYIDRVDAAVFAGCQAVREKRMTSAQGMALIQQRCEAQFKQYKIDLANLQ